MVNLEGSLNGYMGNMSRVFSIGKLSDEAYTAHRVCPDMQDTVSPMTQPRVVREDLYNAAIDMVTKVDFVDKFVGISWQAKFIGHGIGLKIDEAPAPAPRMRQELEPGMVPAFEPRIVIPGAGSVGIENPWTITRENVEKLTICNEEITKLQ